ncbi:MAG: short-chain dehydrogenase/reductase [Paenibacillus sp.]|jgi:benzil reductase ((S)-benzoin forming)|nr:short-chain dehydrogenase/reductase [Paenibacillus sp.]
MRLVIVTGASQGLGEAIVRSLLGQAHTRIAAISRTENQALLEEAVADSAGSNSKLDWYKCNLVHTELLEPLMDRIFETINITEYDAVYLINNAGIVQPIAPAERCSAEETARNVQLNLIAPMVLTSAFIRHTSACQGDKAVLNISSGAGRSPYEGWSSYCSSKAGLDMFTRCVGAEQKNESYPVRVLSIAPGVVDTPMQKVIRDTDPEDFVHLGRFLELNETGQLVSPDDAASKLLQALTNTELAAGSILDVRNLGG